MSVIETSKEYMQTRWLRIRATATARCQIFHTLYIFQGRQGFEDHFIANPLKCWVKELPGTMKIGHILAKLRQEGSEIFLIDCVYAVILFRDILYIRFYTRLLRTEMLSVKKCNDKSDFQLRLYNTTLMRLNSSQNVSLKARSYRANWTELNWGGLDWTEGQGQFADTKVNSTKRRDKETCRTPRRKLSWVSTSCASNTCCLDVVGKRSWAVVSSADLTTSVWLDSIRRRDDFTFS